MVRTISKGSLMVKAKSTDVSPRHFGLPWMHLQTESPCGVAIVSCNDGLRPVIMKLEATDEESKIDYEPMTR